MSIYIAKNGQQDGPHTVEAINAKLAHGEVTGSDLAWMQGWADWQPLSAVPGITFPSAPPPVPQSASAPPPISMVASKNRNFAALDVSVTWRERFEIMERVGWNEGMWKNRARSGALPYNERFRISMNIWGFLFGPFYYMAKGMWKKGWAIVGASFILALLGGLPAFLVPFFCMSYASYDYYLFKVYGKDWY